MAKLAAVITLLALFGCVACQNGWGRAPAPSPSSPKADWGSRQNPPPPSNPPRPSPPASPLRPSPNPAAVHPPTQSPLSSNPPPPAFPPSPSSPPIYPPSPSPIYPPSPSPLSSTPPLMHPPHSSPPNPPIYPPSPSPSLSSTPPPMYPPPSPSPSNPIPPTYPHNASPSPTTYSPSISPTPATSPPISNSPMYTSPSPSPTTYPPSISPTPAASTPSANPPVNISPSSSPTSYPPSISPTPATSLPSSAIPPYISPSPSPSPTNYGPSMSPNPIPSPSYPPAASPPVYHSPSPSPSSPYPTPSPSPSPSSSISVPPSYPPSPSPAPSGLSVGYYRYSCPNAESIVRDAVKSATDSNRGTGAGLIRLFFHDCFVQGCDASVLLNTTGSTQPTERSSAPNHSLRGFEVIDAAKSALEAACPGIVSCADIVAFAGRDATFFLSGNRVDFAMPAGRYDGRVSLDTDALANLPPPFAGIQDLKDMFAAKGLDADDMVTLSGAHTVGVSHCSSFSDRLPPNASDMNATLAASLTSQCDRGDTTVPMDFVTDSGLDSQYYRNVLNHEVLLGSDAALLASNETAEMVRDNAFTPGLWETKFKAAMVKMGAAGVKSSNNGEIRKKCWMINSSSI